MEVFWDQNFNSLLFGKLFQSDICEEHLLDCSSWSLVKFLLLSKEGYLSYFNSSQRKPGLQTNSNMQEQETEQQIEQQPFLSLKVTTPYICNFYFYYLACFS